ncbi:MAG: pantothenate kinase [Spirochaetales bacterium]|nr:MAG: pantothenate kinase [Spirochaetales bacterium]
MPPAFYYQCKETFCFNNNINAFTGHRHISVDLLPDPAYINCTRARKDGLMIIGIDIGGSTTDIVGFEGNSILHPCTVRADDPVSSAAGALGRYLTETGHQLDDVDTLAVTGVGAGALSDSLLGLSVVKVTEFEAIGGGGVFLTGIESAVVVSLGTGTAIVTVDNGQMSHWGGTGVGGGTLIGLSKALFGVSNIETIARKAAAGHLDRVDLSVGDIATRVIPGLPADTTAANFGKMSDDITDNDLALAVVNLVCETVGMIAAGAAGSAGKDTVVLVGKLASFPVAGEVFRKLSALNGLRYVVSPQASFATAVGAAVSVWEGKLK